MSAIQCSRGVSSRRWVIRQPAGDRTRIDDRFGASIMLRELYQDVAIRGAHPSDLVSGTINGEAQQLPSQ